MQTETTPLPPKILADAIQALKAARPNFGVHVARDIDVADQQRKIDAAIACLSSAAALPNRAAVLHPESACHAMALRRSRPIWVEVKRRIAAGDQSGRSCCSMYCLSTDNGTPPTLSAQ